MARMGFRFNPTEQEMIKYLVDKVSGSQSCDDLIRTADLYGEQEPWEIFGDSEDRERYFFTALKKVSNKKTSQRISRNVGQGFWSNKGQKDPIFGGKRGQIIGHRRCFRYDRKKGGCDDDRNGKWILKEYTLPDCVKGRVKEEYRDYALCLLKRKKDGAGAGRNNLDCPDVEIGFEEMLESILNSPQQPAVRSCGGGGGDEDWLQMIDWNVPGDYVCDQGNVGGFVCDQGNVDEPGGFVCNQGNVVETGGVVCDQGNVVELGDFGFDQSNSVDWNVPGGDFVCDQDWNVPGSVFDGNLTRISSCSTEGLLGIDDYLPAHQNFFNLNRLSAPLILL